MEYLFGVLLIVYFCLLLLDYVVHEKEKKLIASKTERLLKWKGRLLKWEESLYERENLLTERIMRKDLNQLVSIKGIPISTSSLFENEIGVSLIFSTYYTKEIKYIHCIVEPYNVVGDITDKVINLKIMGPMLGTTKQALIEFKNLWYSKIIDNVRATVKRIDFMDGTSTFISKQEAL